MAGGVEFTPTAQDYGAANRANSLWGWRRRRTYRAWIGMIASMAGIGAALGWWDGGADAIMVAAGYAALGFVLMPLLSAIGYALAPWRVARLVRQQPSATKAQRWDWNEDGVTISYAQGSSHLPWRELFGWREGRIGIILFLNERSFVPIPRRVFSNGLADDLRASLLRFHVRVY